MECSRISSAANGSFNNAVRSHITVLVASPHTVSPTVLQHESRVRDQIEEGDHSTRTTRIPWSLIGVFAIMLVTSSMA